MIALFWLSVTLIIYTYLGYPTMLAALAKLFGRKPMRLPITPPMTLLIAAYNEEAVIAKKLENSLALDYPRDKLQILVAADGSDDRTPDIVRQFAAQGVELSFSPLRRGKMAAINRAIPRARGEIIVFSDANNMYAENALRELVSPFVDPTVGAVTGAKVIAKGDGALGESEGLYWKYESFIKRKETDIGTSIGAPGEILAMRRELFETPPDAIINDDFFMAMRLLRRGYRIIYNPRARSVERVSATAGDEMARRARIVAGRYQSLALAGDLLPWQNPLVVWQVVSHKYLRPLVPLAMVAALGSNLWVVLRGFNWLWGMALAKQLTFYLLALVGRRRQSAGGRVGKLFYLPTFLVNSNWAALMGLWRFLSGGQSTRWQRVTRRE